MDSLQQSLLNFYATFISSRTTEVKSGENIVQKMLKKKDVQKIIIESMCKLDPIINQEIISTGNSKSSSSQKDIIKKSKLLSLADDIKEVMKNYEFIQGKVSSMREIVDDLDVSYEKFANKHSNEEINNNPSEAFNFLSNLRTYKKTTNDEIDDISKDIWSKHIEVEQMLEIEIEKYKSEMDLLESKYFYRVSCIKSKCGLKIKNLENQIESQHKFFLKKLDRIGMEIEEKISAENERFYIEEEILRMSNDSSPMRDLPSAMQKIRNLLSAKKIYEKRMLQDEKIIKGLNSKLKQILEKFSETQEINSKLLGNFSSLSWCLGTMIERSSLDTAMKEKSLKYLAKQKCEKLEEMLKSAGTFEIVSIETVSKRYEEFREGVSSITAEMRDESMKSKLNKMIIESRIDEIPKSLVSKKPQTAKTGTFVRKGNRSKTLKAPPKENSVTENAVDQLKIALMNIDESIKRNNRIIADDLEDLNFQDDLENEENIENNINISKDENTPKKKMNLTVKTNKRQNHMSPKSASSINVKEDIHKKELKKVENKAVQVKIYGGKEKESQTESQIYNQLWKVIDDNKGKFENEHCKAKNESDLIRIFKEGFSRINVMLLQKESQTEQTLNLFDFSVPENSIIRGMMKKNSQKRDSGPKKIEFLNGSSLSTSVLDEISTAPLLETLPTIEEVKESHKEHLIEATEEYRKEFQLYSQLRGLKKIDFIDIQNLWEEVINRRIIEGEKDRISIYLRGYLGTDRFEGEKKKIIDMIELNKIDTTNNQVKEVLGKKFSEKNLGNWKKIIRKYFNQQDFSFPKNISQGDGLMDILFKAFKKVKFVKHRFPKKSVTESSKFSSKNKFSEGSLRYKPENWTINTITPSLMEATEVKSRYRITKRNQTADRLRRTKSPIKEKMTLQDFSKFASML